MTNVAYLELNPNWKITRIFYPMENIVVRIPGSQVQNPSDGLKASKSKNRPDANWKYPAVLNIVIILE